MTIELLQPHTHAGVRYPPGVRLEIAEAAARWLIERGVAQPVAEPVTKPDMSSSDRASAPPSRKGD